MRVEQVGLGIAPLEPIVPVVPEKPVISVPAKSMIKLRPYQNESIEATLAQYDEGIRRTMIVLPTGGGKTVVSSDLTRRMQERGHGRALFLAHREELIFQTVDKMRMVLGEDVNIGIVKAEYNEPDADIVVASIQTVQNDKRLARAFKRGPFGFVIADECFPAGTLVDGRPIEEYEIGDLVWSFNHETGRPEQRPVTHVFRNLAPAKMVRVVLSDGREVVCTPDHPFYASDMRTGETSYLPASSLSRYTMVYDIMYQREGLGNGSETGSTDRGDVHRVWHGVHGGSEGQVSPGDGAEGQGVLLSGVRGHVQAKVVVRGNGENQQAIRVGSYEAAQPDEGPCGAGEDADNAPGGWSHAKGSWRERNRPDSSAENVGFGVGVGHGGRDSNGRAGGIGVSVELQGGHWERGLEGGDRSGWIVASGDGSSGAGPQEAGVLGVAWVDRVEVLERGDSGRSGDVCGDGRVYNLEVEGNHNYFVDGVLVHNCHHSTAKSWRKVLTNVGVFEDDGPLLFGMTATPDRSDGTGLSHVFESIAYEVGIFDMIDAGYLVDIVAKEVQLEVDFGSIRVTRGEYNAKDSGRVLMQSQAPGVIAEAIKDHASDRQSIVFVPTVEMAHVTAATIREAGLTSKALSGDTPSLERQQIIASLHDGTLQTVVNVGVLTEGTDIPSVSCIVMAQPTRSRSRYCFDEATEVLTPGGWVPGKDVREGKVILAFDPSTGEARWEPVQSHVYRPLDDDERMLELQSPSIDVRVTNNHRVVWRPRSATRKGRLEWRVDPAEVVAAKRDGWYLPVAGYGEAPGVPLTDEEVAFIGWVQTDGCVNKANGAVQISQQRPEQCRHIEEVLTGCGFKWRVSEATAGTSYGERRYPLRTYRVSRGKPVGEDAHLRGWGELASWIPKADPEAWQRLEAMDARQWRVFLDAWHRGDGSKQEGQDWTRRGYHLTIADKWIADWIQGMCLRRGWRANVALQREGLWSVHCREVATRAVGGAGSTDRPSWRESASTPGEMVWCVSVPSGALFVRRNGKASVSGNTQAIGRGLRTHIGKENCLVLDLVGATGQHKLQTISTLFGLPPKELKSKTVRQAKAAEEVDPEEYTGKVVVRDVDVLAGRSMHWTTTANGQYVLSAPPGLVILKFGGVSRTGEANWEVWHVSEHDAQPTMVAKNLSLDYAQGVGEDIARESAGDKNPLTSKDAPWRSQPVTEAQLKRCKWLRIPTANIRTKGEASDAMNAAEAMQKLSQIDRNKERGKRLWERR